MEVLVQVAATGPQARACFETLGIDLRVEKSLRSDTDLEVLNALEVALALPVERLNMSAIDGLLSDVVATWALGAASEEASPSPAPALLQRAESMSHDLSARGVARAGAVSILHERRLHAVARHWATHASEVPTANARLFFAHLEELSECRDSGLAALAFSALALVCSAPGGAALAQTQATFSKQVERLAAALGSSSREPLLAAISLLRALIRYGQPPGDLACLADAGPAPEDGAGEVGQRTIPEWVANVFARARPRLVRGEFMQGKGSGWCGLREDAGSGVGGKISQPGCRSCPWPSAWRFLGPAL